MSRRLKPIPPLSVVRRIKSGVHGRQDVGTVYRIGYYSENDGLDCIWLVDETGKYTQTIDHEYLKYFFRIEAISTESDLFGVDRPGLARAERTSG